MTNLRFEAVTTASRKNPVDVITPVERPSEFFGKKVFNRARMYKYLPADVYEKLIDVIDNGVQLDRGIADAVAKGMKQWADENGVTHYTHWFQPLTEGTAEKHDAFVEHDGKGSPLVVFVLPLKRADIALGTLLLLYLLSTTHCAYPPYLYLIPARL